MSALSSILPRRLAVRLVLLMSVALLPLGLISIWQTQVVVREAEALRRASLLAETKDAAEAERRLFETGATTARTLARVILALDGSTCRRIMENVVDTQHAIAFAGVAPLEGPSTCNSEGKAIEIATGTGHGAGLDLMATDPQIDIVSDPGVVRQPVVVLSHPVFSADRQLLGQVLVSIPHAVVDAVQGPAEKGGSRAGLRLASFNAAGTLISADGGPGAAIGYLPGTIARTEIIARSDETFGAMTSAGEDRLFAVAPLIEDQLYLVGSWPLVSSQGEGALDMSRVALFLPVLMWIAGILVAVFGLQRLVLRHIRKLRSAMRKFALGERVEIALEFDDPPLEFEEAERAFNRMALLVTEAEARRETDLHDKEVLLREVHHRVKNNLQLIASIMNMQMRRARTEEARSLLQGLQQRIRGLATLHRTLYTEPDTTTIDSKRMVQTVIDDVVATLGDPLYPIHTTLADVPLYPDQALPLSMIVSEALANAFKHSSPAQLADEPITVLLEELDGRTARLVVSNPVDPEMPPDVSESDGLGRQLKVAFVRQLEGTAMSRVEDAVYTFSVTFEIREFAAVAAA